MPLNEENHVPIEIVYGQVDGKLQTKFRYVKSGKNIGKANETDIFEQAMIEATSLINKQLDKNYVYDLADYKEVYRPMLAHKYQDRSHKVVFGSNNLYASKKLNGIRCFIKVINNEVTCFESRSGQIFKFFHHIAKDVVKNNVSTPDYIIDGELFNYNIPFEVICSLVNSDEYVEIEYNGVVYNTSMVQFHAYDFIPLNNLDADYLQRFILNDDVNNFSGSVIKLDSVVINNEEQLYQLTREWMNEGYEGLMLRDVTIPYEFSKRSNSLLKLKLFESEEFQIEDIFLAENDNKKVMFLLKNHHNNKEGYSSFDCSVKGNKDYNLQYYNNKEQYIGKWCTVSYQALSLYKVPCFAQVESLREGDFNGSTFEPKY